MKLIREFSRYAAYELTSKEQIEFDAPAPYFTAYRIPPSILALRNAKQILWGKMHSRSSTLRFGSTPFESEMRFKMDREVEGLHMRMARMEEMNRRLMSDDSDDDDKPKKSQPEPVPYWHIGPLD